MKALVLESFKKPYKFMELPKPSIAKKDVLVKVKSAGICGTDFKIQQGKIPVKELPLIPGHEFAGIVEKVGEQVSKFQIGDEVIISFYVPCEECNLCLKKRQTICQSLNGRLGFELDGGFAEYAKVPVDCLIPKPENISFNEASFISDAIATPYHAIKYRAKVEEKDLVVIIGAGGGLGLHAIQIAKHLNVQAIGIDISKSKLDLMKRYGADEVIDASENKNWNKTILDISSYKGADCVIDLVSNEDSFRQGLDCLRNGGKMILIAYSKLLPTNSMQVVLNELDILGSRAASKHEIGECVSLVKNGVITPVIDRIYNLEDGNKALKSLQNDEVNGRIIIKIS